MTSHSYSLPCIPRIAVEARPWTRMRHRLVTASYGHPEVGVVIRFDFRDAGCSVVSMNIRPFLLWERRNWGMLESTAKRILFCFCLRAGIMFPGISKVDNSATAPYFLHREHLRHVVLKIPRQKQRDYRPLGPCRTSVSRRSLGSEYVARSTSKCGAQEAIKQ